LQKLRLSSRIAQKQGQREKAKLDTAVQLFEVEYDQNKDSFGATVGVRIPLGKSSFSNLSRQHTYQQAKLAEEMKLSAIKDNLFESKLALNRYYDVYQLEQQLLQSINVRLKRVLQANQAELVFTLKKEQSKHQATQQDIYLKIIAEYVNFIVTSGQIAEMPLRNWLQKGQPRIKG
jgi:hypothetical protein